MNYISPDTTPEAHKKQVEILRKMSPSERAEMAFQLSDDLRRTVEAGIRHRHPKYDEQMVKKAWMKLTLGERLFREIFGAIEVAV